MIQGKLLFGTAKPPPNPRMLRLKHLDPESAPVSSLTAEVTSLVVADKVLWAL